MPRRLLPLLLVAAVLMAGGCAKRVAQVSLHGEAMGTTYSVKIVPAKSVSSAEEVDLAAKVADVIEQVNSLMSTYDPKSELSRFNSSQSTEPFPVSPATMKVFVEAQQIGEASGGAFDVTVGPLVNAWGFGPDKSRRSPSDDEVAALREEVGWDKLEIDEPNRTLRKLVPGLYCDLSAIAKGFAVDQVSEKLTELGQTRHMVEIGGEVRTSGTNEQDKPWRIAIEAPEAGDRAIERVLPFADLAMATSGDYRNFYKVNGKRLSHTIDPRTGHPIEHNVGSVSVIEPSCMAADGWATALNVLGEAEGYQLAVDRKMTVLFQVRQPDGSFKELATPEFVQRFGDTARYTK